VNDVVVLEVESRPTAVVAATTTWREYPVLWPKLSGEVWACLRAGGITHGCPNVMLYLDDRPSVEVGVELAQPCELTGNVVHSSLPGGIVAMTRYLGPYAGLGHAHQAVIDHCDGHELERAGPRWEVYGPHHDDPMELWTEIYYLVTRRTE
jgi:effector-binding domain-containing protein